MAALNKVMLIGNVGNDPESNHLSNGTCVANFSLATTDRWKDKQSGQMQEKTEWHKVVVYGQVAEVVAQYVRKGSKLYLEGKLQTRKWQDKSGADRWTTEVNVKTLQMLDSKQESAGNTEQKYQPTAKKMVRDQEAAIPNQSNGFDDDIPF